MGKKKPLDSAFYGAVVDRLKAALAVPVLESFPDAKQAAPFVMPSSVGMKEDEAGFNVQVVGTTVMETADLVDKVILAVSPAAEIEDKHFEIHALKPWRVVREGETKKADLTFIFKITNLEVE